MKIEKIEPIDGYAFIGLRHAIFLNFIAHDAPIVEQDLTPSICRQLIEEVGEDYLRKNKKGISTLPKVEDK